MIKRLTFSSDEHFDQLYPVNIQQLSRKHWTPLAIARKAAEFLTTDKTVRILDIGSGVGKFCLAAAHFTNRALYYGIEQRQSLVYHANKAKKLLDLDNVFFRHGNFTQLRFGDYDHFYFYNSFYENLTGTDKIDYSISYSLELYNYYSNYLFRQLEQRPAGTRVATFNSLELEIPPGYGLVGSQKEISLKFWIKI